MLRRAVSLKVVFEVAIDAAREQAWRKARRASRRAARKVRAEASFSPVSTHRISTKISFDSRGASSISNVALPPSSSLGTGWKQSTVQR